MLRFTPLMLIVSTLFAGCTAPAHLMHKSEPTQDEKMQQTIAVWKDTHISKAVEKWGVPNEVSDDGTGLANLYLGNTCPRFFSQARKQGAGIPTPTRPSDPSATSSWWHAGSRWNIHINRLYLPTHILCTSKRDNLQN